MLLLLKLLPGLAGGAHAHALEPGYLELRPVAAESWQVIWRVPDVGSRPMPLEPGLPEACRPAAAPAPVAEGRAWVGRWVVTCRGGLQGGWIEIGNLEKTSTDVLVRYGLAEDPRGDAVDQTRRLTPAQPGFEVPAPQGILAVMRSYAGLGVTHILFGFDHLLFVAGLMLLVRDRWTLFGAVTAFTLAHSLTLAAASLGWLIVPAPPVEAAIALSIVFLAAEALRDPASRTLAQRAPWIVAFGFGLLHGMGFGYALLEIGLPEHAVPMALLAFNLGVEAGQILFVLVVLGTIRGAMAVVGRQAFPAGLRVAGCYAIGTLAAFWTIDRVASLIA